MFRTPQAVLYNNGPNDEDRYAIVLDGEVPDDPNQFGGNVTILFVDTTGAVQVRQNVPRREKFDYASGGGGGETYHIDELH